MADPTNSAPNAIPVSQSPVSLASIVTIISTLALLLPTLAAKFGLTSADAINSLAGTLYTIVTLSTTLVSGLVALIARVRSKVQPVTLTQKAADALATPTTSTKDDTK